MAALANTLCCIRNLLARIESTLVEEELMEEAPSGCLPRSYGGKIRVLLCRIIAAERALDITAHQAPNLRLLPLKKQACCLLARVDALNAAVAALP